MAMTSQEQNVSSEIINLSKEAIVLVNKIIYTKTRFDENDVYNQVTDGELAVIPDFAHVTISELGNALVKLAAMVTAAGDLVDLIKVQP